MDPGRIALLIGKIDGSDSTEEWDAVEKLRTLGTGFPTLLLERYRASKAWRVRRSCVYHALRYARGSDDAVQLGREALQDRSKPVRHRACELLAYSLRKDVISELKQALATTKRADEIGDLRAAINAIEHGNHHYFVDREHSGKVAWTIT